VAADDVDEQQTAANSELFDSELLQPSADLHEDHACL